MVVQYYSMIELAEVRHQCKKKVLMKGAGDEKFVRGRTFGLVWID